MLPKFAPARPRTSSATLTPGVISGGTADATTIGQCKFCGNDIPLHSERCKFCGGARWTMQARARAYARARARARSATSRRLLPRARLTPARAQYRHGLRRLGRQLLKWDSRLSAHQLLDHICDYGRSDEHARSMNEWLCLDGDRRSEDAGCGQRGRSDAVYEDLARENESLRSQISRCARGGPARADSRGARARRS